MKHQVSVLLLCLLCNSIQAQTFKTSYSEPSKDLERSINLPIKGGGYVGMKKDDKRGGSNWNKFRREVIFLLFDKNMNVIKEKKVDKALAFTVFYTDFKQVGEKFWLIYIEPAEKNNIGDIKAVQVDPSTLDVGVPKTIVSGNKMNLSLTLRGGLSELEVLSKSSPDSSKIFLVLSVGNKEFYITVLNEELDTLWSRKETMQDTNDNYILSAEIDNSGNCYLGYKKKNKGYVTVYKPTGTSQSLEVGPKGREPKEILLLTLKDNKSVVAAGTYFNGAESVEGVFKTNISTSDFSESEISKSPFPASLIEQFANDFWASTKGKNYGLKSKFLTHLFEVKNGIVDLVIEMKSGVTITKIPKEVGMGITSSSTVIQSGGIMNVYFGNSNPVFTRIPKFNVADGTYWKHFHAFPFEDKVLIFYNDDPENLKRDIALKPKQVNVERNSVLVAAVIEPTGDVKRILPLDIQESYMAIAEWMQPISPQSLQIPVYGLRKKQSYATISIQ